jgi:heptosyltransferase-1
MRVLLIKTSSMGDIIHTFPALTDAGRAIPGIQFDWVVEESFSQLPSWHPLVNKVIPVALRRWRKAIFSRATYSDWQAVRQQLKEHSYDLILDAQGLIKSAWLAFFARGIRAGLDFRSAREGMASLVYQRQYTVHFYQHAIVRMRQLLSQALNYPLPQTDPDYSLKTHTFNRLVPEQNYLVFLHGTTWASKQWPESYWIALAHLAAEAGYRVKIGGGNQQEVERAKRIANACPNVDVMPYLDIASMANCLAYAKAVVAVDTGFGHLAAALDVPTISLYGSTDPKYTGALGTHSILLAADFSCAPCLSRECFYRGVSQVKPACYATLAPAKVWEKVSSFLQPDNTAQTLG